MARNLWFESSDSNHKFIAVIYTMTRNPLPIFWYPIKDLFLLVWIRVFILRWNIVILMRRRDYGT